MNVLVVDDEAPIRKLLPMMLPAADKVLSVPSVDEAIQEIEAGGYDLIITDYKMPGLNGLDLLYFLQERQHQIPVILITGQGGRDPSLEEARQMVWRILPKPFSHEQLQAAVAELFPAQAM